MMNYYTQITLLLLGVCWNAQAQELALNSSFDFKAKRNVRPFQVSSDHKIIYCNIDDNIFAYYVEGVLAKRLGTHRNYQEVISSKNDQLIAVKQKNTITLLDKNGVQLHTFRHKFDILSVCFSPDNKFLAVGTTFEDITLWNLETYALEKELIGHAVGIGALSFSSDGKYLLSGSGDKTLRVWEVATGKNTVTFQGFEEQIIACAYSPDDQLLLSTCLDSTVHVIDLKHKVRLFEFPFPDKISRISFSPNGALLLLEGEKTYLTSKAGIILMVLDDALITRFLDDRNYISITENGKVNIYSAQPKRYSRYDDSSILDLYIRLTNGQSLNQDRLAEALSDTNNIKLDQMIRELILDTLATHRSQLIKANSVLMKKAILESDLNTLTELTEKLSISPAEKRQLYVELLSTVTKNTNPEVVARCLDIIQVSGLNEAEKKVLFYTAARYANGAVFGCLHKSLSLQTLNTFMASDSTFIVHLLQNTQGGSLITQLDNAQTLQTDLDQRVLEKVLQTLDAKNKDTYYNLDVLNQVMNTYNFSPKTYNSMLRYLSRNPYLKGQISWRDSVVFFNFMDNEHRQKITNFAYDTTRMELAKKLVDLGANDSISVNVLLRDFVYKLDGPNISYLVSKKIKYNINDLVQNALEIYLNNNRLYLTSSYMTSSKNTTMDLILKLAKEHPDYQRGYDFSCDCSPLHHAIYSEDDALVDIMLRYNNQWINDTDRGRFTPIMAAVNSGDLVLVKKLHEAGARITKNTLFVAKKNKIKNKSAIIKYLKSQMK